MIVTAAPLTSAPGPAEIAGVKVQLSGLLTGFSMSKEGQAPQISGGRALAGRRVGQGPNAVPGHLSARGGTHSRQKCLIKGCNLCRLLGRGLEVGYRRPEASADLKSFFDGCVSQQCMLCCEVKLNSRFEFPRRLDLSQFAPGAGSTA